MTHGIDSGPHDSETMHIDYHDYINGLKTVWHDNKELVMFVASNYTEFPLPDFIPEDFAYLQRQMLITVKMQKAYERHGLSETSYKDMALRIRRCLQVFVNPNTWLVNNGQSRMRDITRESGKDGT